MIRRLALLAVALVSLSGCYVSEVSLLDASKAARIFKTGQQISTDPKTGKDTPITVTVLAGGWYEMRDDKDKPVRMIFVPLPGKPDRWAMSGGEDGFWLYGVAIKGGDRVYLDMADCGDEATAAAAARHKAKVEAKACKFERRPDVMGALADYPLHDIKTLPSLPAL